MPLLEYFGWVGSFLVAALLAANWGFSAPIAGSPPSDVAVNQRINIRIHTDHKWPERVVLDTTRSMPTPDAKLEAETSPEWNERLAQTERRPFDAFAELTALPVRSCFRPPCPAGQAAERVVSPLEKSATPFQKRARIAARKGVTFPNPLHKPPGRS
jgi:hypothetical protein